MGATLSSSCDEASICGNLVLMANEAARDKKYRSDVLIVMEENVEAIEDLLEEFPR